MATYNVQIGQVYADNDPRTREGGTRHGKAKRHIRVTSIDGEYAWCIGLESGMRVRVLLSRFVSSRRDGYSLVPSMNAKSEFHFEKKP